MNALQVTSRNAQITRPGGARRQTDGVIRLKELCAGDTLAYADVSLENDALVGHQVNASLDNLLGKLHRRDAILQETTDSVLSLEDGHQMTSLVELVSSG